MLKFEHDEFVNAEKYQNIEFERFGALICLGVLAGGEEGRDGGTEGGKSVDS